MATLNILTQTQVYADSGSVSSNPLQRIWDWSRKLMGITVSKPSSRQFVVDPGATLTVFNGQRSTSIDNTTAFTLTLSPLSGARYRVTKTAGTSPALRTVRSVNQTGNTLTLTAVANGTLQVSLGAGVLSGADFSAVQVGDQVWIPGVTTGDSAGPFDPSNEGLWSVLAVSAVSSVPSRMLTLKRIDPSDPVGASGTTSVASAGQFLAFSASGVQPGDNVEFSSNLWSSALRRTLTVDLVTPDWFEFLSTDPLPLDSGVLPTSSGLVFYTDAKKYVRVETDQEAGIQFNGDTGQLVRVAPITPADPNYVGWIEKIGPTWTLSVVNRSSIQMTLNVFAAD